MNDRKLRRHVTAAIKRSAAIHGEPLSVYTYLTHRQPEDPDKDDLDACFDTWEHACIAAGVSPT